VINGLPDGEKNALHCGRTATRPGKRRDGRLEVNVSGTRKAETPPHREKSRSAARGGVFKKGKVQGGTGSLNSEDPLKKRKGRDEKNHGLTF